jgi:PAS domain S-box-containing protein
MSGYTAAEVLGKTPRILKSGKQDAGFYRDFWQTLLQGKPWNGRVVNRRRSGELFIVTQTVTPIAGASGDITHFVAIHEDVTEAGRGPATHRVPGPPRLPHRPSEPLHPERAARAGG